MLSLTTSRAITCPFKRHLRTEECSGNIKLIFAGRDVLLESWRAGPSARVQTDFRRRPPLPPTLSIRPPCAPLISTSTSMMSHPAFFYGTLLVPEVTLLVIGLVRACLTSCRSRSSVASSRPRTPLTSSSSRPSSPGTLVTSSETRNILPLFRLARLESFSEGASRETSGQGDAHHKRTRC